MSQKEYHAPSKCPVCGDMMEITKVKCRKCGSELSGNFSPCRFCMLEDRHMQFIEAFLRSRGSIKEVERSLGVSYPTVRNMMDAALAALGLDSREEPEETEKTKIFEQLSTKEIDVETAIQALEKLKGGHTDE